MLRRRFKRRRDPKFVANYLAGVILFHSVFPFQILHNQINRGQFGLFPLPVFRHVADLHPDQHEGHLRPQELDQTAEHW